MNQLCRRVPLNLWKFNSASLEIVVWCRAWATSMQTWQFSVDAGCAVIFGLTRVRLIKRARWVSFVFLINININIKMAKVLLQWFSNNTKNTKPRLRFCISAFWLSVNQQPLCRRRHPLEFRSRCWMVDFSSSQRREVIVTVAAGDSILPAVVGACHFLCLRQVKGVGRQFPAQKLGGFLFNAIFPSFLFNKQSPPFFQAHKSNLYVSCKHQGFPAGQLKGKPTLVIWRNLLPTVEKYFLVLVLYYQFMIVGSQNNSLWIFC